MPRFNAFRSKPDQADDKASAHERRFACRQWSLPFARLLNRTRATCLRRAVLSPFVPAKAGTQALALDSRLRGNERSYFPQIRTARARHCVLRSPSRRLGREGRAAHAHAPARVLPQLLARV